MPSELLISRCARELSNRLLTVFNIWMVEKLMHQVTVNKKRKRASKDLYLIDDEEDQAPPATAEKYPSLLYTYLLALAVAGSGKLPSAPAEPEGFGSDPYNICFCTMGRAV
eukprot:8226212-Karenia_brevis.AAC.1